MRGRPKKKLATGGLLRRGGGGLEVERGPLGKGEARPRGGVQEKAGVGDIPVGHRRQGRHLGRHRGPKRADVGAKPRAACRRHEPGKSKQVIRRAGSRRDRTGKPLDPELLVHEGPVLFENGEGRD